MKNKEIHLFIIWSKALDQKLRILADIEENFKVVNRIEVKWSSARFSENLSRFYGEKLPPNSSKEKHCGTDPFLVILVEDNNPRYEQRLTSKGVAVVNINMFDSKNRYREWTGGGHKIHGTDNELESKHNIALLFGKSSERLHELEEYKDGVYQRDLVGAQGWDSLDQLFSVLNEVSNYIVLRNFENLSEEMNALHPDIDVLTDNQRLFADVINGKKTRKKAHRVQYSTRVNGKTIFFDLRYVGDEYYDAIWQYNMLKSRVKYDTFYIPRSKDHFYSLLYHAYIHKRGLSEDYLLKIKTLSQSEEIGLEYSFEDFINNNVLEDLNNFMMENRYSYTIPEDLSVYFNNAVIARFRSFVIPAPRIKREHYNKLEFKFKSFVRKAVFKVLGKRI